MVLVSVSQFLLWQHLLLANLITDLDVNCHVCVTVLIVLQGKELSKQ